MEKLKALLKSRKFWALIAALVADGFAMYYGSMPIEAGVQAAIAALAAYMVGTGLDNPVVK